MAVIIERQSSSAARWARRLALFSAALFITSLAGHRFGAVETVPFFWLAWLVAGFALLALLLGLLGMRALWERGDRGGRASALAIVMAVLVLAPIGFAGFLAYSLPPIGDVSTDVLEPPAFRIAPDLRKGDMNPLGAYPREQADMQREAYADVTGRRYAMPAQGVQELVTLLVGDRRWAVLRPFDAEGDGGEATMETVAHSPLLGLLSDVAIRVTDEGETSYVDMRSVSRYGARDLGDNARKISGFLADLDQLVTLRSTMSLPPGE
ncbi:MAG TPA: DUF1499 domain-containing protein [Rhizobiaceae bacterium]|nr:DUF1499 domain-containing protein [Rhizobiaceae bacterium]